MDKEEKILSFEGEASSFIFDLRNSTGLVKKLSEKDILRKHVTFMLELNSKILNALSNLAEPSKFAFNDTGDGCLCVFWDEQHAITCLKIALDIYQFLNISLEKYNTDVSKKLSTAPLLFGMGLHTAHCCIGKIEINHDTFNVSRDYIFGTVANSVARLESFSKNYIHDNFLVSANFMNMAIKQYDLDSQNKGLSLRQLLHGTNCLGEVDLKDSKEDGHWVHSFGEVTIDELLANFGLFRHQLNIGEIV